MNKNDLELLRQEIDKIDKNILENLKKRFVLTKQIGELKKQLGLDVVDKGREEELMKKYHDWAEEFDLGVELVKSIFLLVINESKKQQELL
ncbi:MAG: chorismate mutase [Candidatus Magasanikiibacteriota bacterium]